MAPPDSTDDAAAAADALLNGTDDEKCVALAAMPRLQYERLRQSVAESMGVGVVALDFEVRQRRRPQAASSGFTLTDVPQWPDQVDGAELLDAVAAELERYVVMPPASRDAIALWIVLTYAVAAVFVLPMLVISSPQKRCGKSTLLIVLHKLCKRALLISNITAPALYRTVETHRPTLLLDEADTWCRENQEMRGVLDCGHTRETAHVLRVDGEKLEPRVFDCFTPKALAGIGSLADTIHDRAIVINLKRRAPGETVQRLRQDRIDLSHLKSMSARWAADHLEQIRHADAAVPQSLNDRASDNWRPLFGIAALAGGAWPARTRQAALELSANDADDDNVNVLLLGDIRTLLTASGGRMASKDLCSALVLLPERPWGEWKHGRPMTMNQLARRLKPFGIESRSIRTGHDVFKGYDLADCIDTFARYLKNGDSSVTPLHRLENKPESADLESYRDSDVTVRTVTRETSVTARNVEFPGKNSVCNDVTAETDKSWDPQEGIEL